jgi:hypothetical protein
MAYVLDEKNNSGMKIFTTRSCICISLMVPQKAGNLLTGRSIISFTLRTVFHEVIYRFSDAIRKNFYIRHTEANTSGRANPIAPIDS